MTDLEFVEKLLRDWVEDAHGEYVSSQQAFHKGDRFRVGELRGRFESLESFADYLHFLQRFPRHELDKMKRL